MRYSIPEAGYYQVSAQMRTATPVGEAKLIPNPDKKWWQFWKEDHVVHQEWIYNTTNNGLQIRYCVQGEVIDSDVLPIRLSAMARGVES
jgi:hypothetical protein